MNGLFLERRSWPEFMNTRYDSPATANECELNVNIGEYREYREFAMSNVSVHEYSREAP